MVHEKTVAENSAVKQSQKAAKNSEFVDTDSDDSGIEDKQKPKKESSNGKKLKRPHSIKINQSLLTQARKKRDLKKHQAIKKDCYKGRKKDTKDTRVY